MRTITIPLLILALAAFGCGREAEEAAAPEQVEMPSDAVHQGADRSLDRRVELPEDVQQAWSAVRVRVTDTTTGAEQDYTVAMHTETRLGDTGLTLIPTAFVPDFTMTESGITTRSPQPENPAAQVVIVEDGNEVDYRGWLFADMPEIHAYPHQRYLVRLVEGVRAGAAVDTAAAAPPAE